MNELIFIGGCYSADKETRSKIAIYGKRINQAVIDNGFKPSLNLLGNPEVFKGVEKAEGIKLSDGRLFLDVAGQLISKSKKSYENVRGLRYFETENKFRNDFMASAIAMSELKNSIAGIFEISSMSQGSYYEIALAIHYYQIPVLALSHETGREFGRMLTGSDSLFLQTAKYNDSNLEAIIEKFLKKDLYNRKLKGFSYKIPQMQDVRMKKAMAKKGYDNISEFMRNMIDEYLEKEEIS